MVRYTQDQIRTQLLVDRDCSRTTSKIWTQRAAAATSNSTLASDRGDAVTARGLRKQADIFRGYAATCLADSNTINAAIGALEKDPALLTTVNNVPQQRDMALAVARAINAAIAQQRDDVL
jgi:hypothetical protein